MTNELKEWTKKSSYKTGGYTVIVRVSGTDAELDVGKDGAHSYLWLSREEIMSLRDMLNAAIK